MPASSPPLQHSMADSARGHCDLVGIVGGGQGHASGDIATHPPVSSSSTVSSSGEVRRGSSASCSTAAGPAPPPLPLPLPLLPLPPLPLPPDLCFALFLAWHVTFALRLGRPTGLLLLRMVSARRPARESGRVGAGRWCGSAAAKGGAQVPKPLQLLLYLRINGAQLGAASAGLTWPWLHHPTRCIECAD